MISLPQITLFLNSQEPTTFETLDRPPFPQFLLTLPPSIDETLDAKPPFPAPPITPYLTSK